MKTRTVGGTKETPSLRTLLGRELTRRCADHPQYSLRAFARFLRVDHATLSQILRGKRALGDAMIRRLAARLGHSEVEIQGLLDAERSSARTPNHVRAEDVRELAKSASDALGTWHDFAILELLRLDSFVPDARFIARVLDCELDDVQLALHRLTHLGFLEMTSRDHWVDRTGHTILSADDFAEATAKRLADELSSLSLRAMTEAPPDRRAHHVTTIAVHRDAVPRALARLDAFRRELVELLEDDQTRDEVYQLAITFFPLTTAREQSGDSHG